MNRGKRPVRLTMYSREGCHLCDEARDVIESVAVEHPLELVEVDIESSDRLMLAYLERIPVVECDGEEWFEYTVERSRLIELVTGEATIRGHERDH